MQCTDVVSRSSFVFSNQSLFAGSMTQTEHRYRLRFQMLAARTETYPSALEAVTLQSGRKHSLRQARHTTLLALSTPQIGLLSLNVSCQHL